MVTDDKFTSVRSRVRVPIRPLCMVLDPKLITTQEAAEITGYDASYIRRILRKGYIVGIKRGRDWLVNRDSILRHVEEMKRLGMDKFSPTRRE